MFLRIERFFYPFLFLFRILSEVVHLGIFAVVFLAATEISLLLPCAYG